MIPAVGESSSITKSITQEQIDQFAELSSDRNPVHLDDAVAKKTRFGKRIAHGMWAASLVSAVLGTQLPGPGTIYLSQTISFRGPVFAGDAITATVKVTNVREDKAIVTLETTCTNQNGDLILSGEAVVLVEELD